MDNVCYLPLRYNPSLVKGSTAGLPSRLGGNSTENYQLMFKAATAATLNVGPDGLNLTSIGCTTPPPGVSAVSNWLEQDVMSMNWLAINRENTFKASQVSASVRHQEV